MYRAPTRENGMSERDPFTGTWAIRVEKSRMGAPGVRSWVQRIEVEGEEIRVREEVESGTGARASVRIEAKFDGKEYAVAGSSLADAIAYTRLERNKIVGTGTKDGNVTLRETIEVSPGGGSMTLTYMIYAREKEVTSGVAVFEKERASGE